MITSRSLKPITDIKAAWNDWKKEEIKVATQVLKKNKSKVEIECVRCHKFIEHDKYLRHSTVRGCPSSHPFYKLTEFKKNFTNMQRNQLIYVYI